MAPSKGKGLSGRGAAGSRAEAMRRRQWALGCLATGLVLALWLLGAVRGLELPTIDWRARWFSPGGSGAISPDVAVVAIDDAAERNIERWPWRRSKLAAIVRELTRAGADVIALDILLRDPQAEEGALGRGAGSVSEEDADLAAAVREHGRVVLASGMPIVGGSAEGDRMPGGGRPAGELGEEVVASTIPIQRVMAALERDPGLVAGDLETAVRAMGKVLLGESARATGRGAEWDELRTKVGRARTLLRQSVSSSVPVPVPGREGDGGPNWPRTIEPAPPLPAFADAASRLGVVSIESMDPDSVLRRIPMWVEFRGRLWSTLSLSAVAEHSRIPVASIEVEGNRTRLRRSAGVPGDRGVEVSAPLERAAFTRVSLDGMSLVSWPRQGGARGGWLHQLTDPVTGQEAVVSIGSLYEPKRIGDAIRSNSAGLSRLVDAAARSRAIAGVFVDGEYRAAAESLAAMRCDDPAWAAEYARVRAGWVGAVTAAREFLGAAGAELRQMREDLRLAPAAVRAPSWSMEPGKWVESVIDGSVAPIRLAALDIDEGNYRELVSAGPRAIEEIDAGVKRVEAIRAELKARLSGRIVFVGWTATGANADFVATSIDQRTPGVVVHAAAASSLLTGYALRSAPWWVDAAAIAVLGVIGTWIGVSAGVAAGPVLLVGAAAMWLGAAGFGAWRGGSTVVAVAGPTLAAGGAWLGVMLHRLLVEQRARRRTEERFRSYVSPAVVDILVNNPELNSMAPQQRELTVMFSDLEGFTSIAERLGSVKTAEVLAKYLGAMTDILQSTGATLDKYLGDGIMAFWGAPLEDAHHARHACGAAIRMAAALERMNDEGAFGEAGRLRMRVGLAAGDLMVGDFGNPPRNSSYTIIGDASNLASRLEGANKQLGTRVLVSRRVRDLAGEGFEFRLIGRIVVVGKAACEEVYELLGWSGDSAGAAEGAGGVATKEQRRRGDSREAAVRAFIEGRLEESLARWSAIESQWGPDPLAGVYRRAVEAARQQGGGSEGGAGAGFGGTISLTDK